MCKQVTFEQAFNDGKVELLLTDALGIYIPSKFLENYWDNLTNKEEFTEDRQDLASPDLEYYWESWDNVLDNAILKGKDGHRWTLYQDGNLWAIRTDANINWDEM